MHDQTFWQATENTFYYTAMALPAGLMVSLGLAMLLNVEIPGRAIWRTIIFMPSLVPVVATAMVWMWMLNPRLGLINILLTKLNDVLPAKLNFCAASVAWGSALGYAYVSPHEPLGRWKCRGDLSGRLAGRAD